jgi:hypothetical protein
LEIKTVNVPYDMVFWNLMPCSLVDRYLCFEGTCCLHLLGRRNELRGDNREGSVEIETMNKLMGISDLNEVFISGWKEGGRKGEGHNLVSHRYENVKSHMV